MSKKVYTLTDPTYYLNGKEELKATKLVGAWKYQDTDNDGLFDSYLDIGVVCYSFTTDSKFLSNPEIELNNLRCYSNANVVMAETMPGYSAATEYPAIKHLAFKITKSVKDDYMDMFGNNNAEHPIGRKDGTDAVGVSTGVADFECMIGNADSVVLLPNTKYYLWIYLNSMGRNMSTAYPAESGPENGRRFQFANHETITLTMDEMDTGTFNLSKQGKIVAAIPYVVKASKLNRAIPNIVKNGKLYVCS